MYVRGKVKRFVQYIYSNYHNETVLVSPYILVHVYIYSLFAYMLNTYNVIYKNNH